jgi:hypothetical protein
MQSMIDAFRITEINRCPRLIFAETHDSADEAVFQSSEIVPKQTGALIAAINKGTRSCCRSYSTRFTASSVRPPCPASQARERSHDRDRHGTGGIFQHQRISGACFRHLQDALMERPASPSGDRGTVWLADLIETTEVVAASSKPCDPAIMTAFSHRLEMRADIRPLFDVVRNGTGG